MAERRTRKDKVEARTKWVSNGNQDAKFSLHLEKVRDQNIAYKSTEYYNSEMTLPLKVIKTDLTRTVLMTILALILQIGLYVYFKYGGWNKILPIFSKISL